MSGKMYHYPRYTALHPKRSRRHACRHIAR